MSQTLLSSENALKVAEEIVDIFEKNANQQTLEVDFKLSNGKMEVNYTNNKELQNALQKLHGKIVPQPNTSLSFDAPENTMLCDIKNYFCEKMVDSQISDHDYEDMQEFLVQVIRNVNGNSNLVDRIKNALRKVNGADSVVFPFDDTMIVLFEFGDKEDYGDMIKVLHYSRYSKQLQSFVGEKKAVAQDLLLRRRQFGYHSKVPTAQIYAQIISEQKSLNNPLYEDIFIEDVKIVREAKECHLDLFVNYSPIEKDAYLLKIQETESA